MSKITSAAAKSLSSGIDQVTTLRSSGGHICQDAFVLCKDGRVLKAYFDRSEPSEKQVTHATVSRLSWMSALNDAANS